MEANVLTILWEALRIYPSPLSFWLYLLLFTLLLSCSSLASLIFSLSFNKLDNTIPLGICIYFCFFFLLAISFPKIFYVVLPSDFYSNVTLSVSSSLTTLTTGI